MIPYLLMHGSDIVLFEEVVPVVLFVYPEDPVIVFENVDDEERIVVYDGDSYA